MIWTLMCLAVVLLLALGLGWLGRRTWAQMGGHSPTPHDRSQRQNRRAAEKYYDSHPGVQQARFARRRTVNFDK